MANPNRSPASTASSRPSLTRVTVNLTPAAKEAAEKLASEQGINLTDTINRALRIAAIVNDIAPNNRLRVVQPDEIVSVIYLL